MCRSPPQKKYTRKQGVFPTVLLHESAENVMCFNVVFVENPKKKIEKGETNVKTQKKIWKTRETNVKRLFVFFV